VIDTNKKGAAFLKAAPFLYIVEELVFPKIMLKVK